MFLRSILRDFNRGAIDAASAAARLDLSRTRLYVLRTTGKAAAEVWQEQIHKRTAQFRPTPEPSLFESHFSLRATRKVHLHHIIQFDGRDYEIAPTSRKSVTLLFHPRRKRWVLEHSPNFTWSPIFGHFTL